MTIRRKDLKVPMDQDIHFTNCKPVLAPHNGGKAFGRGFATSLREGDSGGECGQGAADNVTIGRWVPGNRMALWG